MNEMRKLIEAIDQINEDSSVGGNMRELAGKLTDLASFTEQLYWNYEKYPQLAEYQAVVEEVRMAADVLRKKVHDIR